MLSLVDSAKATTNLWGERWGKLVANTMTTGVSGVTGLNLMSVLTDAATRRLMIRLGAEAIRVGLAQGYAIEPVRKLDPDVWIAAESGDRAALAAVDGTLAVELERMTDAAYSGVAQDLRKGRRTEIDHMNGFVAEQGDAVGTPAPTHKALTAMVKKMERKEITPQPHLVNELM